jgi:hypothetical protein
MMTASMQSRQAQIKEVSGSTLPMPCSSASGNISPASTTTNLSLTPTSMQFIPISPRPPIGSTRSGGSASLLAGNGFALLSAWDSISPRCAVPSDCFRSVGFHCTFAASVLCSRFHLPRRLIAPRASPPCTAMPPAKRNGVIPLIHSVSRMVRVQWTNEDFLPEHLTRAAGRREWPR